VSTMIDFDAIKVRHPLAEYCQERRGIELHRNGSPDRLVGLCPLHTEKTPSFTVFSDNHFKCFGCGEHGDVTDLEQLLGGGTRAEAAERLGAEQTPGPVRTPVKPEPEKIHQLTKDERDLMVGASVTLRRKPKLALEVRAGLPLNAVQQTAVEGNLGFLHKLDFGCFSGPALLFQYAHGIKARWIQTPEMEKKPIRWICGGAARQCWRQNWLKGQQTIYFTEGEPDALGLISWGYDVPVESLVIALASAETIPDSEPFTGRDLILVPDTDPAGQRCAERFRARLGPGARSITIVNLGQPESATL
jgi:hypothetical protein